MCTGPRARPSWAGPGRAAAGLSRRRQPPGRLHFVRGAGGGRAESGRGKRPGVRGAPERPLCLPHPGGGGGGRWARAAGDALRGAAPGTCEPRLAGPPASDERPGDPRPARRPQHAAIWRLARPGLAPKVGKGALEVARWFQSPVLGGGRVCENKELPSTHRSLSCPKCYNKTVWFRQG